MRLAAAWRTRRVPVTIQLTALTASVFGVQGLTALLTAKWLGASDRGVLVVAQTIALLLLLGGGVGLLAGTRVLLADPHHGVSLAAYLAATRWLLLLQAILALSVGVGALIWLVPDAPPMLLFGFVLQCVSGFRAALIREALHGLGRHRYAVALELWAAAVPLVLVFAAYLSAHLTVVVAQLAVAVGLLAQWLTQCLVIRRHRLLEPSATPSPGTPPAETPAADLKATPVRHEGSLTLMKRMAVFSLPGLAAAIGLAIAGRADRLILAHFHGSSSVGVYATAATLAAVPWVLTAAVTGVIVRGVAQSGSTGVHGLWWRRVMVATTGLAVLTYATGAWVLDHFLAADFAGAGPLLAILLFGGLAMASQQVDLAVCSGRSDLGASARSAAIGLVFGLAAYVLLIPPFGAYGAAWGSVVTYFAMALSARWYVNKHIQEESA